MSFRDTPDMFLCLLWQAVRSLLVSVAVNGHSSALYRRVDKIVTKVAQLSQRDRAAGWVSYGQKWKTGTGRQYLWTL